MKLIIDIDKEMYKRICEAQSVPDMYGTDVVNAINRIRRGTPYEQRPQGKWIKKQVSPASCTYVCSECGVEEVIPLVNFCCWCGADMRGGKE